MPVKIILASTSRYRVAQLKAFGLKFSAQSPRIDEEKLKRNLNLSPRALSRRLALEKALSLAKTQKPGVVVIGADQLLNFRGRTLGKPHTFVGNVKMLRQLQNQTHELITSVAVVYGKKRALGTVTARIKLRKLSSADVHAYVKRDRAFDCAGGYKFEKAGFSLVEKISVTDPSSLIGLSLITLQKLFVKLEIPVRWSHE